MHYVGRREPACARAHVFMRVHACNLRPPRPGRRVLGVEFVAPYLVPEFMKAGLAIIYSGRAWVP